MPLAVLHFSDSHGRVPGHPVTCALRCGGGWDYELGPNDMEAKVDEVVRLLNDRAFDVLVAHCPPYQILDKGMNGSLYGNPMMLRALLDLAPEKLPRAYLCGHIHSSAGDGRFRGMYVSNAATKMRLIPNL